MLSSFSIGIFHCKVFALGSCPDRISRNFDTNSHVLKTSTSGQILHRTSSWCFSSLIFSEPLHTFALLFIRPCSSGRTGRARPGFRFIYLFPRSRQRRSEVRPAWGPRWHGKAGAARGRAPGAGRGGGGWARGGAWRGGACPRSAAGGRVQGWVLLAEPAATAAVARDGCSPTPCGSSRFPPWFSANSPPPERETSRRSARELWCLSLGAPREKAKRPQVKPVSQNGPGTPAASLHLLGTATAERFPAPATQGARGEWSPLRGKERRGHR